jgi:PIN domain nuclease of toxin-antitoxin system
MIALLDTHLLLWIANDSKKLSSRARKVIDAPENKLAFSVTNLWEIMIKQSLGRVDFSLNARRLRGSLLSAGYLELNVTAEHTFALPRLPPIHQDPFDRMLLAQAITEGWTLLTSDKMLAKYGNQVMVV